MFGMKSICSAYLCVVRETLETTVNGIYKRDNDPKCSLKSTYTYMKT